MGLNSLPVAFGIDKAKWITVATIDVTQLSVAAYLGLALHEPIYGGVLTALVLPQVGCVRVAELRVQVVRHSTALEGMECVRSMHEHACTVWQHVPVSDAADDLTDLLPVQVLHPRSHQE